MSKVFYILIFFSVAAFSQKKTPQDQKESFEVSFFDAMNERLKNNFEKSNENFETCLRLQPENDAVLFKIAQNYYDLKDYENAKKMILEATEINPNNKWYQLLAIQIEIDNGTDKQIVLKQIKDFEPVVKNKYIVKKLYQKLYQKNNPYHKPKIIKPSVEKNQKDLKLLYQSQQYAKLITEGEKQLELTPENPEIYLYIAKAFIELKKYPQAEEYLEMGIDFAEEKNILKQYYQTYYQLYQQTGQTGKARFYKQKIK